MSTKKLRVLLVVHGFPPDLRGGTEATVEALAHGLVREGMEVSVFAGTDEGETDELVRETIPATKDAPEFHVYRLRRSDLHNLHWHKSNSPLAGRLFEEVLRRERPDVVHIHHWLRLSRDLVHRAARLGIPSVVTLHDMSTSCLVFFRVRPDDLSFCEKPMGPDPCLSCTSGFFFPTPWITPEESVRKLERLRDDSRNELRLARVVTALCSDQARLLENVLNLETPIRVVPPASDDRLRPAATPDFDPGREHPLVLGCWATLHLLKGTDLLIESVRRLTRANVPVTLDLAGTSGDPAWIEALRNDAKDLPIRFHGPFEKLDGHPVTRVHAFVAGTRARETWGVVLDEALRLKLPMVLPRFGAYAERFREGRGVLFYERGNPDSLAGVLARLQSERGLVRRLRDTLPSRDVLPTRLENTRRYLELYEEAIGLGAPSVPPFDPRAEAEEEAFIDRWDSACSHGESKDPHS